MQALTDNIYVLVITAMVGMFLLALAVVLLQVTARNRILVQKKRLLDAQVDHQRDLLHATVRLQEQERKRIGMDLHDSVGSSLSALRMMIGKVTRREAAVELGGECNALIDRVIQDVRDIAHNLSPPLGEVYYFSDMLEDLCDWVNRSGKVIVSIHWPAESMPVLEHEVSLALYRVLTELIQNTIRHSGAGCIDVCFELTGGELRIRYRDDGSGLGKPLKMGMGLHNIESRLQFIGASFTMEVGMRAGFGMVIGYPLPAGCVKG